MRDIYSYGSHVTAHVAGKSVDCWIQQCITSEKGLEYEVSTRVVRQSESSIQRSLQETQHRCLPKYQTTMWYIYQEGHKTGPNRHPDDNMIILMNRCQLNMDNQMGNTMIPAIVITMTDGDIPLVGNQAHNNMQIMRLCILMGESHSTFKKTKQVQEEKPSQET